MNDLRGLVLRHRLRPELLGCDCQRLGERRFSVQQRNENVFVTGDAKEFGGRRNFDMEKCFRTVRLRCENQFIVQSNTASPQFIGESIVRRYHPSHRKHRIAGLCRTFQLIGRHTEVIFAEPCIPGRNFPFGFSSSTVATKTLSSLRISAAG